MSTQAETAESFGREQGCTVTEWLRWLPGAVGPHALHLAGQGRATVAIGSGPTVLGHLHLTWTELPPRQIALMRMPRLQVDYRFDGVDGPTRTAFMRYFDLYLQRGGG